MDFFRCAFVRTAVEAFDIGHESTAVSRQYAHLTTDDKRAAMHRLPDVTGS